MQHQSVPKSQRYVFSICQRRAVLRREERLALLLLEKDKKRLLLAPQLYSQSSAVREARDAPTKHQSIKINPSRRNFKEILGREENKHPANSCHAGA
jgi:hypothetical protein